MELAEVVKPQYAFPVGIVLICAVFVFAFGFKSSNPPEFNQLVHAADDRKTAGKKRKLKDKKSVQNNLSSSSGTEEGRKQKPENHSKVSTGKASKQTKGTKDEIEKGQVSSSKQQLPKKKNISQKENVNETVTDGKRKTKDGKLSPEEKKIQPVKDSSLQIEVKGKSQEKRLLKEKNNNIQQVKNARNNTSDAKPKGSKSSKSKVNEEKPIDFDDGEWEQAISRKEKKSKKKDEESLLAATLTNTATNSSTVNQSAAASTLSDNVPNDMSAPASGNNSISTNHHNDPSKDTPAIDTSSKVDNHTHVGASDDILTIEPLNEEAEKKESSVKASAAVTKDSSAAKPKSSKSKGKNKESGPSIQKDNMSMENGNVSTGSLQVSIDEATKSKKKKKQTNVADSKDGKPPTPAVESSKQQNVAEETPTGEGEQDIVHDITSTAKVEPAAAVVFDELGDVWKEAKAPKKNKKKVRKDQ